MAADSAVEVCGRRIVVECARACVLRELLGQERELVSRCVVSREYSRTWQVGLLGREADRGRGCEVVEAAVNDVGVGRVLVGGFPTAW